MKFSTAIDEFVADWKSLGKMRSPHTEKAYRDLPILHAEDVDNRDPSKVGKRDLLDAAELLCTDQARAAYASLLGLERAA